MREATAALDGSNIISLLSCPQERRHQSVQRLSGKLERALERTRKAVVNLLDVTPGESHIDIQLATALRTLLETIVNILQRVLEWVGSCPYVSLLSN